MRDCCRQGQAEVVKCVLCLHSLPHLPPCFFQRDTLAILGAPERKWLKARQRVLLSKILEIWIPIHFWYLNNAGLCIPGRYVSAKQIISCAARQALVVISWSDKWAKSTRRQIVTIASKVRPMQWVHPNRQTPRTRRLCKQKVAKVW